MNLHTLKSSLLKLNTPPNVHVLCEEQFMVEMFYNIWWGKFDKPFMSKKLRPPKSWKSPKAKNFKTTQGGEKNSKNKNFKTTQEQ
jgi:hypothetical protein